jgi:hypothetical protein
MVSRFGSCRRNETGEAWRGWALLGVARHGTAWSLRCLETGSGGLNGVRHGTVGHGVARPGRAWSGKAVASGE